jgi:hypothetical protein
MSWGYYVVAGGEPDCESDSSMFRTPVAQNSKTPGIWNPLPFFDTVRDDGQEGNVQSVSNYYAAARARQPIPPWDKPTGGGQPAPTRLGQDHRNPSEVSIWRRSTRR